MLGRFSGLWGSGRRPTRCFLLQTLLTPLLHLLAAPYSLRGSFPSKNHHSLVSTSASRNEWLKAWLCFLGAIDADNSTYNHAAWSPIPGQTFPIRSHPISLALALQKLSQTTGFSRAISQTAVSPCFKALKADGLAPFQFS